MARKPMMLAAFMVPSLKSRAKAVMAMAARGIAKGKASAATGDRVERYFMGLMWPSGGYWCEDTCLVENVSKSCDRNLLSGLEVLFSSWGGGGGNIISVILISGGALADVWGWILLEGMTFEG